MSAEAVAVSSRPMIHRAWSLLMLVLPLVAGCSPERKPCKIVLPEGFEGAATIVWGNLSSPELPTEGALFLVEIPGDGILKTSTQLQAGKTTRDELYWRKGSELVAIPEGKRADRTTGSYRLCGQVEEIFIGDRARLATMKSEMDEKLDLLCSGTITVSSAVSTAATPFTLPRVDPEVGIGVVHLGMARALDEQLGRGGASSLLGEICHLRLQAVRLRLLLGRRWFAGGLRCWGGRRWCVGLGHSATVVQVFRA